MSDPLLQREAEVPRTRSTGGAIVVAVAFFSLFTALGASAFVIRVRALATRGYVVHPQLVEIAEPAAPVLMDENPQDMQLGCVRTTVGGDTQAMPCPAARPQVDQGYAQRSANVRAGGPVAVELLTREEAVGRAERQLSASERENVARFRAALHRGDAEVALLIYNDFGSTSPARYVLESERTVLADDWLATQMARLERELAARDCGAVNERIERISRLVPDRHLPSRMDCR
jgi:hypothetical protein